MIWIDIVVLNRRVKIHIINQRKKLFVSFLTEKATERQLPPFLPRVEREHNGDKGFWSMDGHKQFSLRIGPIAPPHRKLGHLGHFSTLTPYHLPKSKNRNFRPIARFFIRVSEKRPEISMQRLKNHPIFRKKYIKFTSHPKICHFSMQEEKRKYLSLQKRI